MNLQVIRSACHETVFQSIIHALMNEGTAYSKAYNAKYGAANFTLMQALEWEKWKFGVRSVRRTPSSILTVP